MTDPVKALAAALRASHAGLGPGSCRLSPSDALAALRASGFDVVPTGDAGLDVERLRKAMPEWFGQVPDWALFEWAAEYARLSSSDTGGRG